MAAFAAAAAEAGYPKAGDPNIVKVNGFFDACGNGQALKLIGILTILVLYVTMVYGPIAAALVEFFPTRIRYTGDVAALPHRQRLVRRLPAPDRLRHGGVHRRHLLRPLVPDRDRARRPSSSA